MTERSAVLLLTLRSQREGESAILWIALKHFKAAHSSPLRLIQTIYIINSRFPDRSAARSPIGFHIPFNVQHKSLIGICITPYQKMISAHIVTRFVPSTAYHSLNILQFVPLHSLYYPTLRTILELATLVLFRSLYHSIVHRFRSTPVQVQATHPSHAIKVDYPHVNHSQANELPHSAQATQPCLVLPSESRTPTRLA
jgi:hypothetical protein